MSNEKKPNAAKWDAARQTANVGAALFQIAAGAGGALLYGPIIARVSDDNASLVTPADWAFVIWNPIFLLSIAYAVYQALPANRQDPLLRRIGWFVAGAFFANGVWELLFPARQLVLAQVAIVGILAGLAFAYVRLAHQARGQGLGRAGRWLVAPTLGLFFGWLTAATLVGFATTLVGVGLVDGGTGEAVVGVILLLAGGLAACAVILYSGPPQAYLAYAAAVLWALAGIISNQRDASLLTTGAALVGLALLAVAREAGRHRSTRQPPPARVV